MLKEKIKNFVDSMEVDVSELESACWDYNIYGVESHIAVGGYDWDEDEEYEAKKEKAIERLDRDGIGECIKLGDSAFERDMETYRLTNAAIKFVETL